MLELDFAKSVSSFRERTSNIVISSSEFRSCCKTQEIALCLHKHVNGVICSQFFQCIVIKLHRLWKMLYCETKMFSLKSVATSLTDNNYFKYCQITCQLLHHVCFCYNNGLNDAKIFLLKIGLYHLECWYTWNNTTVTVSQYKNVLWIQLEFLFSENI